MGKYFSDETQLKLKCAGIGALHLIPGYSSLRSLRFIKEEEGKERYGELSRMGRKAVLASVVADIIGSLYIPATAIGALPLTLFGLTLKLPPGIVEGGIRYHAEMGQYKRRSDGAGGESAAAAAYPASDKIGEPQEEMYRLAPTEA